MVAQFQARHPAHEALATALCCGYDPCHLLSYYLLSFCLSVVRLGGTFVAVTG